MSDDLKRWLGQDPATLPTPPPPAPLSAELNRLLTDGKEEVTAGVRDAHAAGVNADQVAREAPVYGFSPEQAQQEMERGGR